MTTLSEKTITIFNKKYKISFAVKQGGKNPKLFVFINNEEWTSWNLCNYKRNKAESFKDIENLLLDGSYLMF